MTPARLHIHRMSFECRDSGFVYTFTPRDVACIRLQRILSRRTQIHCALVCSEYLNILVASTSAQVILAEKINTMSCCNSLYIVSASVHVIQILR